MKEKAFLAFLAIIVGLFGCTSMQRGSGPVLYDNATISIGTDNLLLFPKIENMNKEFTQTLAMRLSECTKAEMAKQDSLKVTSTCEPRTLKIAQEITGITVNTVTDTSTGFFLI